MNQNNLGNQEMIWVTQFSTMGGPVGDPYIWVYPQYWYTDESLNNPASKQTRWKLEQSS